MRATELFKEAPDVPPDELSPNFDDSDTSPSTPASGFDFRIVQIEDHDLSPSALEAMDSGSISMVKAENAPELEASLLTAQSDYCVRVALIDEGQDLEGAVQSAMLADVDLIVVGADAGEAGRDAFMSLSQAARMGHGVYVLQN